MRVACIQFSAGIDVQPNIKRLTGMIIAAAEAGARLVVTPENSVQIGGTREEKMARAASEADHPAVSVFGALAGQLNIHLIIGSLAIRGDGDESTKLLNRAYHFSPKGQIAARYDKIHLFDVDLPNGETYRESENFTHGHCAVLSRCDDMTLGLTICYDVRFAGLYRALAQKGADVLVVPAAFTVPTGRAHWEVLLRARAIETGSYVLAPAMWGEHAGGRKTYGHSMIITPWGEIIAHLDEGEGIIYGNISRDAVDEARARIPALHHDRQFTVQDPAA